MGAHKLAILVSAVGAAKAAKELKGVDAAVARIGSAGGRGIRNLTTNLAALGAVAAVGIGVAVKSGLANLATLETAVTSVDGAITQMGLTGKLTGAQVATWANEIESSIGAAFDDKDITAATTTLLRFGKVTPGNLRPAMQVITDLATKTGDVDSAASLLAKALADPAKAAGKLARSGVVLTKSQQAQIKAFVKAGKTAEAQKVILDALTVTTKGAAAASQGPYKRAMSVLADVTEDAQKALAEGFLPVIQRVADWLGKKLADPKVIEDIRGFGKSLAGLFDKGVDFATKIPWGSVRDAAGALGTGAKMALDAFLAMPAWVQTAVVGGWGLNKLTGGALGDIAGELGKGLIKGVLGMNAGVVNINAAVVNGAGGGLPGAKGGVPGIPAGAGGGALAAIGGIAGFTAVAGAAALALYYGVPALMGSKPANGQGDAEPIRTTGGGTIEGPNAGMIRLFTPALKTLDADVAAGNALQRVTNAKLDAVGRHTQAGTAASRVTATEIRNGMRVNVPVTVRVGFTIRELQAGIRVQKSYAGGYGSR